MQITIVGCGDAFGSAGRLQTTYLVESANRKFLIDCGATAQIGLNRLAIDANGIETILISHLHGDHYAGLIWMVLSAQFAIEAQNAAARGRPADDRRTLQNRGRGAVPWHDRRAARVRDRVCRNRRRQALLPMPTSLSKRSRFSIPSGAPSHALRIAVDGRMIAFSGDTEWVEALVTVAAGADLYITECCAVDRQAKYHLNWRTIEANLPRLTAKLIMITHMNQDMLSFAPSIASERILIAEDGLKIAL